MLAGQRDSFRKDDVPKGAMLLGVGRNSRVVSNAQGQLYLLSEAQLQLQHYSKPPTGAHPVTATPRLSLHPKLSL